jgi:CBS domain-containing protein
MARIALSVPDGAPLSRAASLMAREGLDRIAVVGAEGAVVGVLAAGDVLAWSAGAGPRRG